MSLLTSINAAQILGDAGMTVVIGLVVVFSVLLLLTGVFKLFGVAMSVGNKGGAGKAPTAPVAPAPSAVAAPIVGNTETVSSKPDVDGGIPEETVAVVSAAVASMAPTGTQYAVRGIRKL